MGFWIAPGEVEMPAVTAPMTGRTVGATTSFAVRNQTSGAGGKPVLPVFGRSELEHKKKKYKQHTEWFSRGKLRLVETEDRPPLGLTGGRQSLRREQDKPKLTDLANKVKDVRIQHWHEKNKIPGFNAKQKSLGGKVIDVPTPEPGWKPSKSVDTLSDVYRKRGK